MEARNPHTRGSGDSATHPCGNKTAGKDIHRVCANFLWMEHTQQVISVPGLCQHCKVFTTKRLRRWLACQVSLSGRYPYLSSADPSVEAEEEKGDATTGVVMEASSAGIPSST